MRYAVTGAGGAIGSRVVAALVGRGHEVVAFVRDPLRPLPAGVDRAVVDYSGRDSLVAALRGVARLVFIGSDGEADRVLVHHRNLVDAAGRAGVGRVVLLGSQDADPGSPFCYAHTYATTEEWLAAACREPLVVRAGLYAEFFGRWVLAAAGAGELALPMGGGRVATVARRDVADCLVAAVTGPAGQPQVRVVTGPESFDHAGLAAVAAELAGRPVSSRPCDPERFARHLLESEASPWWRYAFQTLFAGMAAGGFGERTDDVLELTGRPPEPLAVTLRQFVRPAP